MASKTALIPRYLLPQNGPLWRTSTRTTPLGRSFNPEVGQVPARHASKTAGSKATTASKATKASKAPKVITSSEPARASSTKSAATKATKAAKASAPTKPPKTTTSGKTTTTPKTPKTPSSKPAVSKPAATSKPAASKPAAEPTAPAAQTPAVDPIPKTETAVPETSAPAPESTPAPKAAAAAPPEADPSKPIVLEKPERFNPPSHGKRLPRSTPKHYGGPMTPDEFDAQKTKHYPGLPPPENTWSHWFINSRGLHMFITLGTLTSLAAYTFTANFNAKSPFAHMIPPISELPRHPFQYMGVCMDVLRMHEEHESAITAEKRRRKVEDVAKRNEYRKAHGLEPAQGLWGSKALPQSEAEAETAVQAAPTGTAEPEPAPTAESTPEGKRKKVLGIF